MPSHWKVWLRGQDLNLGTSGYGELGDGGVTVASEDEVFARATGGDFRVGRFGCGGRI